MKIYKQIKGHYEETNQEGLVEWCEENKITRNHISYFITTEEYKSYMRMKKLERICYLK